MPDTRKLKGKKGQKPRAKRPKKVSPLDPLKMEIAKELGLIDKVKKGGWGGLTSRESGQLGGLMTRRIRGVKAEVDQKAVGDSKGQG
ncbi:MAG: alpha/beta-type small acid-soluble spore protein [Bacillota bacterium]|nr:alpha/beta-type small acid-soluble spore protein [Bacillota bacterium]